MWSRKLSALDTACRLKRRRTMAVKISWKLSARFDLLSITSAGIGPPPMGKYLADEPSVTLQYNLQFELDGGQIVRNINSHFARGGNVFPTWSHLVEREVLEFNFWRNCRWGNGQMSQYKSGQCARDQLADPLMRTNFDDFRPAGDQARLASRRPDAQNP